MDLKEIGYEVADQIHIVQDWIHWRSLMDSVINFGIP
jgi:hypothetical protein